MAESKQILRLATILKYLEATPDSRCVTEGEEVLAAKLLIMCGVLSIVDNKYSIIASCLQTSALTDKPHEIRGTLMLNDVGVTVDTAFTCSCKAGLSGACKHISACLLYCNRNDVKTLAPISSTDIECSWNKSKTIAVEDYKAIPVNKYTCLESNMKRCRILTAEEKQKCLKKFREGKKSSILYKHFSTTCAGTTSTNDPNPTRSSATTIDTTATSSNTSVANSSASATRGSPRDIFAKDMLKHADESHLLNFETHVSVEANECCKKVLDQLLNSNRQEASVVLQRTDEWKELRRLRITGSKCYSIFTYRGLDWEKKSRSFFLPKSFSTPATRHGIKYEDEALNCYREETALVVAEMGFVICKKYPWLGFSPDGIVLENGIPIKLVEIKCPLAGIDLASVEFANTNSCKKYIKKDGENLVLNRKHTYFGQIQLGLALLNLQECDFILYSSSSKTFLKINVKYDKIFAKQLIETISTKYFKHMLHFVCKK